MSITAASMSQLLTLTQERNFYQMQQIYWSNEHTAMTAKVKQHEKYQATWNNAYDKIANPASTDDNGKVKVNGKEYTAGDLGAAEEYAYSVCEEYNEETLLELSNLEVEYESMQQMYETLLEETNARIEQQKELVSENAKDTGLLNAG